jgi:ubiquinone/menaquinone biosynthesis C-methylase UbiE
MTAKEHAPYVLGSEAAEVARLELQAQAIAQPTLALLRAAGIGEGMRVLDIGTGPGHVSLLLAGLVGPSGEVIAIDRDPRMLEHAETRRAAAGVTNVRYLEGDARTFRDAEPFDAIAERLVLFHLADAVDVVRHHLDALRPGGIFAAIDFDVAAARTEPPTELVSTLMQWALAAFRAAGADPAIGTRLTQILAEAGLAEVGGFGIQGYLAPDDPAGPPTIAGVVRSLAHAMVAAGIATEAEIGLDTLEARVRETLLEHHATVVLPTVSGAFGRRPA